jgi:hypothetical protein
VQKRNGPHTWHTLFGNAHSAQQFIRIEEMMEETVQKATHSLSGDAHSCTVCPES